jgi:EmrB/QacA subfamily drug resistance transporter
MNNRIIVMISIVLSTLIVSMDTTITNTTMPVIAGELGGLNLYAWTFAAYMIVSTVLTPVSGRLADLFGRKNVFGAGIILFLFGSLLCGMSQSMLQMVIFRGIQGIGAGVMMPFPAIIAGDLFSVEKRGKIQAVFSIMWGLSSILAPMLGAFFVEYSTWRWIFYVNVPVCIIALLMLLPYKDIYAAKRASIDYLGSIWFALAISLLLTTTVAKGQIWIYALAGLVFLVLFIVHEKNHRSPMLPFSIFNSKAITWMTINSFLACAALFGTSSYIPMYMQQEGYSLFLSGAVLLSTAIGWMGVSSKAGGWIIRYGYRPLLLIGNAILVVTGLLLANLPHSYLFAYTFVTMLLQGAAYGLIFTVSIIGAQQLVAADRKGVSTSLQMFSRNIGTAIGVTVMGAILTGAADLSTGIHHLFLYGFIASLVALVSSFFIVVRQGEEEAHSTVQRAATEGQ